MPQTLRHSGRQEARQRALERVQLLLEDWRHAQDRLAERNGG